MNNCIKDRIEQTRYSRCGCINCAREQSAQMGLGGYITQPMKSAQEQYNQEQIRTFNTHAPLKLTPDTPAIDPRIPQLMNIFSKLSNCHQDALIAMAVVLMRIPKEVT